MPKPFDATLKQLIQDYPADWLQVLGLPAAPVHVIDAELSTVTTEADKVLRVDQPSPWLLHIELQSGQDAGLGQRLLRYNVLLTARHNLPAHSTAILLRPAAARPTLMGLLERHLPGRGNYLTFRFQVVRIWEMQAETLTAGIGTLPLAPLAAVEPAELPGVIRRMKSQLEKLPTTDTALLWSASYILAGLRYPKDFVQSLFSGVRAMKESSTYQAILEEGRSEGRSEGLAEEAHRILLRLGRKRLGEPDAASLAAIEAIQDVKRLEALSEQLLEASSWPELLAPRAAGRPRNGKKRRSS